MRIAARIPKHRRQAAERAAGRRRFQRVTLILVLLGVLAPRVSLGQFGKLFGGGKGDFRTFLDPGGAFQLEVPKDWRATAGAADVIVTFAQKDAEAAIVVERFRLNQPLREVTDLFGQIEMDTLKERQPRATNVSFKLVTSNGRTVAVIDYTRPGLAGQEQARQYSVPIGQDLYRLNCSAAMSEFAKVRPIFLRIAGSFAPLASNAPGQAPPGNSGQASVQVSDEQTIGKYRIVGRIGRGGMGVVYKGVDSALDREVAVKVMSNTIEADDGARTRFFREARAAAKLQHRNIVTIYEFAKEEGVPYIVMEFLRGKSLAARISEGPPLTVEQALDVVAELCAGLQFAQSMEWSTGMSSLATCGCSKMGVSSYSTLASQR